jgi:hypothetical protein
MPVEVVHRHERQLTGGGKCLGRREAHQQSADQPRPVRNGHRVDVVETSARAFEGVGRDGIHQLEVVARGDLRHNPAIAGVQQPLRRDHVGRDLSFGAHDGGAGVVATRLDPEDHAVVRSSTVRHMMSASSRLSW